MTEFIGPAAAEDELGVWQPALPPAPSEAGLESFGPGSAAAAEPVSENLWRIALPEDRGAAARALDMAEARLAIAESALPQAENRLRAFAAAGGPSPAIRPGLEAPELELAAWCATAGTAAGGPAASWEHAGQPVDELAALPDLQGAQLTAIDRTRAFFDKIRDSVRDFTVVQTDLGATTVALTRVAWTGDMRTAWLRGLPADDAQQHLRAVGLALRTRDAWLRLALTIVRGAVLLAALFAATPLLALPAVYRFIRQIIDQVQALPALT